uniref:Uncharacterized protein n=1 Tax=Solanum tuberosum TaxID=4113 RepID=M1DND2_SOLTU
MTSQLSIRRLLLTRCPLSSWKHKWVKSRLIWIQGQKEDYQDTPWPIQKINLEWVENLKFWENKQFGEPKIQSGTRQTGRRSDLDHRLNHLDCWRFCKPQHAKVLLGASSSGSATGKGKGKKLVVPTLAEASSDSEDIYSIYLTLSDRKGHLGDSSLVSISVPEDDHLLQAKREQLHSKSIHDPTRMSMPPTLPPPPPPRA